MLLNAIDSKHSLFFHYLVIALALATLPVIEEEEEGGTEEGSQQLSS
jgi:hypothetical protein